jgi:hypothetical protein
MIQHPVSAVRSLTGLQICANTRPGANASSATAKAIGVRAAPRRLGDASNFHQPIVNLATLSAALHD